MDLFCRRQQRRCIHSGYDRSRRSQQRKPCGGGSLSLFVSLVDYVVAGTPRGFTLPRMNSMMESMGVPGWKIAATPTFL